MFIVTGASFALMKSAIFSSIGLFAHDMKHHASVMSYVEATYACGTFAGYFVFSAYGETGRPGSTDWLMIYFVIAGVAMLAMLWLWFTPVDESQIHTAEQLAKPFYLDFLVMVKLATSAVAVTFVASVFNYDVLSEGIMKWLPTYNNEVLHIPVALSIQLTSILAGTAVLGRVLGGIAVRFFNWLAVLLTCLALSAFLVVISLPLASQAATTPITSWQTAPLAAYIFPLIGMATAPIYPIINSAMLSALPPRQHGAMSGLIMLSSALGATVGSLVTGHVFELYGGASAFYWTLIPMAVLAGLLVLLYALEKKATTSQPGLEPASPAA
jgi:MFS transporter, FHS family, glucose/mannose:H+ symporter